MNSSSGSNGNWDRWIAVEIGSVKASIQAINHRIEDNRQSAFRELWLVRRELLGKIVSLAPRHRRSYEWVRHVPWFKLAVLFIMAILLLTGHLTVGELKAWLLRRIQEF